MRRPSVTTVLLVGAATARATAIALSLPDDDLDPRTLVLVVEVLVPTAIAAADHLRWRAAESAAVAHGSLGAGMLMAAGLAAMGSSRPVTGPLVALLVAATLAMLAGAAVVGRWQDRGAPAAGPGPRVLRAVAVTASVAVGVVLLTSDVAVLGGVAVPGGTMPGPIGIATTVELRRLPLLVAALLPMAWAATRTGTRPLRAVALVLGARAVVEAVADASLLGLGAPLWPTIIGAAAAAVLLVVVPAWGQATSSRA